jgi:hypothetical protein
MAAKHEHIIDLQQKLSKVFGELTLDLDKFKHFGVDIEYIKEKNEIIASQQNYLNDLKDIEIPTRCNKTAEATADKITEFRALVSAVAWLGVTSPFAITSASILQSHLPKPTWGDIVRLNSQVQQLRENYTPLIYRRIEPPLRLINVSDSSFGNSGKYSQGGFFTLLCHKSDSMLCGPVCILDFKSNKSKRVATSTMHAEALAQISGLETATYIQSYLLEVNKPDLTALSLLNPEQHEEVIQIVSVTDCEDLYAALIAPAQASCSNKHLSLYLAAIREMRTSGRVQSFVWADTRDLVANALTKLNEAGLCETAELLPMLKTFVWNLRHAYKWDNVWCTETDDTVHFIL